MRGAEYTFEASAFEDFEHDPWPSSFFELSRGKNRKRMTSEKKKITRKLTSKGCSMTLGRYYGNKSNFLES